MSPEDVEIPNLAFHPLTPARWLDLVKLFGQHGACGGYWCMFWRLSRSEFMQQRGDENKKALKKLVDSDKVPGILGYVDNQPIGWCAIAPRILFQNWNDREY